MFLSLWVLEFFYFLNVDLKIIFIFKMIVRFIAQLILRLLGWNPYIPEELLRILRVYPRITVIYSHTSYWDYFFFLLYMIQYNDIRRRVSVLIREDLFQYRIIAMFLRFFGGIPAPSIHQKENGTINKFLRALDEKNHFIFLISPKGTRAYREWRTGWYYLGRDSKSVFVPLGFNYITHQLEHAQICKGPIDIVETYLKDRLSSITPLHPSRTEYPLQNYRGIPKVLGW